MLGNSCIVTPIRLLKRRHRPLLRSRKIPTTFIDPGFLASKRRRLVLTSVFANYSEGSFLSFIS